MDKFLLAENPMRPGEPDKDLWIVHLLDPIGIICCTVGNVERGSVFKHFQYINNKGISESWTLSIYYSNSDEPKAFKLLDRAWRWYRAYMEFEDGGIEDEETGQLN